MALTDAKLRKLINKKKDPITLSHRDGLRVKRNSNGTLSWQYRFRYQRKQQIMTIGYYPEVSLKGAQDMVPLLKAWIAAGDDPRIKIKQHRQGDLTKPTPAQLTEAWFDAEKSKFKEKTQILYANNINKWILPHLTEKPAEDMSPLDWHKFFDFVRNEGSAKLAPIILIRLKSAIRWAAMRGEIPNNNPILDLKTKHVGEPTTQGQRWLTFKEIALLWRQIEQSKATPTTKGCLQAVFITGARQSEVRLMRWEHIDFESATWTVPPENSKTNKAIRRPLTKKLLSIINNQGLVYGRQGVVFPGANLSKSTTVHSINQFCDRMWNHLNTKYKIPKFVPHDARRSLSTLLSEQGVLPHVTEKMLGHAMRGVMAVYNKHDYINDQREAYELYWQCIEQEINKL